MVKVSFDYDSSSDALYLFDESRKSAYSVEFSSSIIADVDANGNICGLEILNASEEMGVSKRDLEKIKDAELSTLSKKGALVGAGFILMLAANEVIKSKLMMPARSPCSSLQSGNKSRR